MTAPRRPLPPGPAADRAERERARRLGETAVRWFGAHARDLPWRRTDDPYRIWVAEVLLQQTRVDQALDYYERFLATFPRVEDLARAPAEKVLKAWEGAGYYARARRLHEAARWLVTSRQGLLPSTPEELQEVPGFGPYMSRSVAALAFRVPTVALDANSFRVLSRIFRLDGPGPKMRERAGELGLLALGDHPPRAFNEALMELGQRYCRARTPLCEKCPVRVSCRARKELPDPSVLPRVVKARKERPSVEAAVGVWVRGGRVLVQQRPAEGLLGGMWEFPGGKLEPGETPRQALLREFREEVGVVPSRVRPLGIVEHDYSHFHVRLHVFRLEGPEELRRRDASAAPRRWTTRQELEALPLPGATRKMLPWIDTPPTAAVAAERAPRPPLERARHP